MAKNRMTEHHIRPTSRGGDHSNENIAYIKDRKHRHYHNIFGNMTPDEIIVYLVTDFWNNQWYWLDQALQYHQQNHGRIFDDNSS